ncbi:MAG: BrnA antitoxin family protein [Gemmatimonadales bacterium]
MTREYDFSKGKRGAIVPTPPGKTKITIRIDSDVLDWFRAQVHEAGGGNYQTLMNQALRSAMDREPLEKLIRRAVRTELRRAQSR